MEVLFDIDRQTMELGFKRKIEFDEEMVRWELIRVWTKVLDRYAQPGAYIPPIHELKDELWKIGSEAAIKVVCDEHWWLFPWMVRDEIEQKVARGLNLCNFEQLVYDIKLAQKDPAMLRYLRQGLRDTVMSQKF